jgi:hypothetical protein
MISSLVSPSIRTLARTGLLLGALALLVPQWAAAQVPQQFVNAPASNIQDVHPTDVNGDGNVDLVAASGADVNPASITSGLKTGVQPLERGNLRGRSIDRRFRGS